MNAPTTRQMEVYEYIVSKIENDGYPPSYREIGQYLGLKSLNGVTCHLGALARKGMIVLGKAKQARSISIVKGKGRMGRHHPAKMDKVRNRDAVEQYRERYPWCQMCEFHGTSFVPGSEIHHIIQGAGRSDEDCNLLTVCLECHRSIHAAKRAMTPPVLAAKAAASHRRLEVLAGHPLDRP